MNVLYGILDPLVYFSPPSHLLIDFCMLIQTSSMVISFLVKSISTMPVLSTNVNHTRMSLYQDSGASKFMPYPVTRIISISGALTATQVVGPNPFPWQIPWKVMGEPLFINNYEVPYTVLMWCYRSRNVPSMKFIGCVVMSSCCIAILATECTIQS